jgi:hypothetical protein
MRKACRLYANEKSPDADAIHDIALAKSEVSTIVPCMKPKAQPPILQLDIYTITSQLGCHNHHNEAQRHHQQSSSRTRLLYGQLSTKTARSRAHRATRTRATGGSRRTYMRCAAQRTSSRSCLAGTNKFMPSNGLALGDRCRSARMHTPSRVCGRVGGHWATQGCSPPTKSRAGTKPCDTRPCDRMILCLLRFKS